MGEMNEKQAQLEAQINELTLNHSFQDGAILLTVSGKSQILNLTIDENKIDLKDKEQLEDFVILALNEALAKMEEMKVELTNSLMSDMLPPGLSGLKDLFS